MAAAPSGEAMARRAPATLKRMRERGAFEIGPDQRHDGADTRQPEPDRGVFRPVAHHQRHRRAFQRPPAPAPSAHIG